MLLVSIERGYLCHFIIGQRKVENRDILLDMVGIARTGNDDHAPLQVPSEDDLRYRLVVSGCDFGQHRVAQQLLLMSAPAEGILCFDDDAEVMEVFYYLRVLIIRVNLILNQYRPDVHFRQKFVNLFDIVT